MSRGTDTRSESDTNSTDNYDGRDGQAPSPCDCDFHRGMTEDQAWSTLP